MYNNNSIQEWPGFEPSSQRKQGHVLVDMQKDCWEGGWLPHNSYVAFQPALRGCLAVLREENEKFVK